MSFWSDQSTEVMYIWREEHADVTTTLQTQQTFLTMRNIVRAYFALLLVQHSDQTDAEGVPLGFHVRTAETGSVSDVPAVLSWASQPLCPALGVKQGCCAGAFVPAPPSGVAAWRTGGGKNILVMRRKVRRRSKNLHRVWHDCLIHETLNASNRFSMLGEVRQHVSPLFLQKCNPPQSGWNWYSWCWDVRGMWSRGSLTCQTPPPPPPAPEVPFFSLFLLPRIHLELQWLINESKVNWPIFDNRLIHLVCFLSKMTNICWFQLLEHRDLLQFLSFMTVNEASSGFGTVGWPKEAMWRCRFGLPGPKQQFNFLFLISLFLKFNFL